MSVVAIRTYPDPVLKEVSNQVTSFDDQLVLLLDDMRETMYAAGGIGLAAPQIGVLQRVAVVDVSETRNQPLELINPEIISAQGEVPSEEGCLSIPDYRDTITRNESIVVRAQNRSGKTFETEATELFAICLQHEIDHLNGILFVDRLSRLKRELFKRWLKRQPTLE